MKLSMIVFMVLALASPPQSTERDGAIVLLQTPRRAVQIDHLFFETASGRTQLPSELTRGVTTVSNRQWSGETRTADGHRIRLAITPRAGNFAFSMTASPATDITKWGLAIESKPDEYFTGLMERVVDGPQLVVSPIWEKGKRSQQVYLPAGARWRDAWHPEKTWSGGQTIETKAEVHQIPLFIRVGANLPIGDLNREWQESVEIARRKPDLKTLESTINFRN